MQDLSRQMVHGFEFRIGDIVDVFDDGLVYEGKVWKVERETTDGMTRYFCKFRGHPEWDHVISNCLSFLSFYDQSCVNFRMISFCLKCVLWLLSRIINVHAVASLRNGSNFVKR